MNTILLFIIMKIGIVASMLFWAALLYLLYLLVGFCRLWWGTEVDTACWGPYWRPHRRKTSIAAVVLLVSMLLPTTREATAMYVIPAVAQSSIWDRIFGHGDQNKLEEARRWVHETVGD